MLTPPAPTIPVRPPGGPADDDLLERYGLPALAPEEALRGLSRVAAALCGVPTAVVNLLGSCVQHQVAAVGFPAGPSPRAESLCALAEADPRLRHVPDAALEPAFAASAWVDGRSAQVRFYASAPLVLPDGQVLGSLCVFDDRPHHLDQRQRDALADLAAHAVALLEGAREAREAEHRAALFRLVAEGSVDVLSRYRPDGTVLYVSPSLREVLGHDPADEVGVAASAHVHPEDRPALQEAMRRVLQEGAAQATATVRAEHADGTWRHLEIRLAPIRDEAGAVLELHAAARDTTDRVEAERRSAQSAEQVRSIVDSCADAFVATDDLGRVVDWNRQAEETFGWSRAEALGQDLAQLVVPEQLRDAHTAGLARLRAGAEGRILGQRLLLSAVRRDGSPVPVDLTVWRSRWDGAWRYNAFLRDVSEREQARQDLARAHEELAGRQEFLSAVLESTQAGIVACDADGNPTLSNGVSRSWHGADSATPLDGAAVLFEPDGEVPLAPDRLPLLRALRDGSVTDAELLIAPAGRAPVRVLCQGRRLTGAAGATLGAVVVMHDVTALRQREEALAAARDDALTATRAKTAFLAAASHEIRTPLNGVLGTLELLAQGTPLTARQSTLVGLARSSAESLLSLLNDVLDLSKAETTSITLAAEPFSPVRVAEDVCSALRPLAARKDLQLDLEVEPPSDLPTVVGDPGRLRQVLMNLVGNALKFTAVGGVAVTVRQSAAPRRPGLVRLSVRVQDSGPGMSAEEVQRLFQPFVQGEQGLRAGGTGLGLALSQQVVELMGGGIEVDSSPGAGSAFTVVVDLPAAGSAPSAPGPLPVPRAALEPARAPEPPVARPSRRARVLVADDSDLNLLIVQGLLEDHADVATVTDGDEAVEAVRVAAAAGTPFDLVLLDQQMPRMSGSRAARAIRDLPEPACRTRLVALSASLSAEDEEELRACGVTEALSKPVRGEDLRRVVDGEGEARELVR